MSEKMLLYGPILGMVGNQTSLLFSGRKHFDSISETEKR